MNLYVELRHLRYVIAVAEELHFTRAAERLHLSAPSLSKQIKQLEEVLGYPLFERKTREVVLTPAGAAFVTEARQALTYAERAVECSAAASRGDTGVLTVGYTPWLDASVLPAIRSAFVGSVPGTQIAYHSGYSSRQVELILNGGLHAGIVVLPIRADGLRTHGIWREPLAMALPEDHPLACRQEIEGKDLVDEPMIWPARAIHSGLQEHLLSSCQRLGFVPTIVQEVITLSEALDLVASGVGVTFVKVSTSTRLQRKGVVFREFSTPGLALELGIAYREDSRSVGLQSLVRLLREQWSSGNT